MRRYDFRAHALVCLDPVGNPTPTRPRLNRKQNYPVTHESFEAKFPSETVVVGRRADSMKPILVGAIGDMWVECLN
jgi:hypothetical protein